MEQKTICILGCLGNEIETITITGVESTKTTSIVTKYARWGEHVYEAELYSTQSPEDMYRAGLISAEDALMAETAGLRVLVRYVRDAVDEGETPEVIGYTRETF